MQQFYSASESLYSRQICTGWQLGIGLKTLVLTAQWHSQSKWSPLTSSIFPVISKIGFIQLHTLELCIPLFTAIFVNSNLNVMYKTCCVFRGCSGFYVTLQRSCRY